MTKAMHENHTQHVGFNAAAEAEDWLVLLQSDKVSEFDQRRFQLWLQADHTHKKAFDDLQNRWVRVAELVDTTHYEKIKASVAPNIFNSLALFFNNIFNALLRRADDCYESFSPIKLGMSSAFAIVCAFSLYTLALNKTQEQTYLTQRGQTIEITLDDGSELSLAADSEIDIRLSNSRREAQLVRGQAFFAVAKDRERPFTVNTGVTQIRVLGTRFEVNKSRNFTVVSVEEGVVEVSKQVLHSNYQDAVSTTQLTLTAGQSVSSGNQATARFSSIDSRSSADIASWRTGRLNFDNADFAEFIASAQRYYLPSISLSDSELKALKVTASFDVKDVSKVLEDLTQVLPINLHKDSADNIVITYRRTR